MNNLVDEMPLLKDYHNTLDLDLTNVLLVTGHHILESNKVLLDNFVEKGLYPGNIHVIGKCYSSNYEVMNEYNESGYNISKLSNNFDNGLNFSDQYGNNIELFIDSIFENIDLTTYDKVIIWDDGGKILEYIKKLPISKTNFYGIEHTSNGFHRLNNNDIQFPVVNVARSDIKLEIESHFVAELAYKNFKELINIEITPVSKVLIIGGGAIGKALESIIQRDFNTIQIIDSNPEKSNIINYDLFELINSSDIIFGCTGNTVINIEDFTNLSEGKIFASLSSGDYEFPSFEIRQSSLQNGIWDSLYLNGNTILNGGFPITFRGLRKAIPSKQIQITRTLIYGAVNQIMKSKVITNKFIDLDKGVQNFIKKNSD